MARRTARAGATREFARRAASAGAACSVALSFRFFFWLLRGTRRWSARRA
ncbi:hypothetical protein A2U01_0110529, partial [Trifolium medium]|nr:hypothetical protein [Trifolium medium]